LLQVVLVAVAQMFRHHLRQVAAAVLVVCDVQSPQLAVVAL
jgi:hypothetical protein